MTTTRSSELSRDFPVKGANDVAVTVHGPELHPPDIVQGVEDVHNPRVDRLRSEYGFLEVIDPSASEFEQQLALRHWVSEQWPIDDDQRFSGDVFAILERAATTDEGFHCSHAMRVQHAVMTASGFVARDLGVDRNSEIFGRSYHHGVNEVWSNEHAKWILLDAKYDTHFERDGTPMSALEVHEAIRAGRQDEVQMMQGPSRKPIPNPDPGEYGPRVDSYWWVSYHIYAQPFTQPHLRGGRSLVVPDNEAFREDTWYRGEHGDPAAEHWAYEHDAFIPIADRHQIEWTPGVTVPGSVRKQDSGRLAIDFASATPNLKGYRVRSDGGEEAIIAPGEPLELVLPEESISLTIWSRNELDVEGPRLRLNVSSDG